MSIHDKHRMVQEIHRVLMPGAKIAFHQVLDGDVHPSNFPVPWASLSYNSFLESAE